MIEPPVTEPPIEEPPAPTGPSVTIVTPEVAQESELLITGTGFEPNTYVMISVAGADGVQSEAFVEDDGTFFSGIWIDEWVQPGTYTVLVREYDQNTDEFGLELEETFTVVGSQSPGDEEDPPFASVSLQSSEVVAGENLIITGTGFEPFSYVDIGAQGFNGPVRLVLVDDTGSFTEEYPTPVDLEPGVYGVLVDGDPQNSESPSVFEQTFSVFPGPAG